LANDRGSAQVNAPGVFQKLTDRFGLRSGRPGNAELLYSVQPTTNLDLAAQGHRARTADVAITATGFFQSFQVPQGERWHVMAINFRGEGAGTYTYNFVVRRLTEGLSGTEVVFYLSETTYSADNIWRRVTPNDQGPFCGLDKIGFQVDAWTTESDGQARIAFMRELCGPNA